ncbi:MAG: restriction endonuclease [Isosphaeraceae bacterium]
MVAEEHDGDFWAIQAKAYDSGYRVTKHDVDAFLAESARSEFSFRLLIATTNLIGHWGYSEEEALEAAIGPELL